MVGAISFPVQKHSYCILPLGGSGSSAGQVSWSHSPYRDQLYISFDSSGSESVSIKVIWKTDVLEEVDLAATKRLAQQMLLPQQAFVVIVRAPCIGVKYMFQPTPNTVMIRRFQVRFASNDYFNACREQFARYNCVIKDAMPSAAMQFSQSQLSPSFISDSQPDESPAKHAGASLPLATPLYAVPALLPPSQPAPAMAPSVPSSQIRTSDTISSFAGSTPISNLLLADDTAVEKMIMSCLNDPQFVTLVSTPPAALTTAREREPHVEVDCVVIKCLTLL
ncbi:uncharacterized protein V1510DRAFT_148586 [Dipodascopsis tothii]|uniref:uncharacterized protein n=1 Tax=Dipodascopsis tothii TaxID=44089 RepID=UPI0034CF8D5D